MIIRPRRDDDIPALVDVLVEQRPSSGYPHIWPLPFPLEEFVARDGELGAWVVEIDGRLAGHASVAPVLGAEQGEAIEALWSRAAGRPVAELGVLSALFTASWARGIGAGRALHDAAVACLRDRGLTPCLDVVSSHAAAIRLYERAGWVNAGPVPVSWMPEGGDAVYAMVLPAPQRPATMT